MASSTFFIIFAVLSAGILVVHAVVVFGIIRAAIHDSRTTRKGIDRILSPGDVPSVALIVPARNEEALLPRLLSSLKAMDLSLIPDFQLVLVNDRSTDSTREIMATFADEAVWPVHIVDVPETNGDTVRTNPKQNALHHGTVGLKSEVLLFTDADCVVDRRWVNSMVLPFCDPGLGLLFGTVMPNQTADKNNPGIEIKTVIARFLYQFQGFDHLFRFYYTAGSAGIGNPTGGFGNNIAVRRSILEAVGGFAGLRYSVTEDAELIAEVRDLGRLDVRVRLSPNAIVSPEPQHALPDMVSQSVRWNTGGLFAPDHAARYSYRIVMLYLLASVVAAPFGVLYPPLLLTTAGSFLSMIWLGIVAGATSNRQLRYWVMLIPNVLFSMVFYSSVTLMTLARTPIRWKGRVLRALNATPAHEAGTPVRERDGHPVNHR